MVRDLVCKMKTYYDILGVPRTASSAQIRAAFLLLAKAYHPDTTLGLEDSRFRQLCETYNVLVNPAHPETARITAVWHQRYPWDKRSFD